MPLITPSLFYDESKDKTAGLYLKMNSYNVFLYIDLMYYNFLGDRLALLDDRSFIFPDPPTLTSLIFRGLG